MYTGAKRNCWKRKCLVFIMKIILQRVKQAKVIINSEKYSSIKEGLLLLVGFENNDQPNFDKIIKKILNMRVFNDKYGKMNHSILDINGELLVISQFTLLANIKKGNRPSYINACEPVQAKKLYDKFINLLKDYEINVEKGRFGAHMNLDFINDGPVTIIMDDN